VSNFIQRAVLISVTIVIATLGVVFTRSVIAAPLAQSGSNVQVCDWLDCKIGAISYSQDDAININPTISGTNSCKAQLEDAGFRGTFFYNGNDTSSPTWLADLTNAGHEVGSHLANHDLNCSIPPSCFPNCTPQSLRLTPYTITDVNNFRQVQIDPNVTTIESYTGKPVVTLNYSCGSTDAARMTAAQYYFAGARGYYDPYSNNFSWIYDVNTPTPAEFMNLNSDTYFSQPLVDKAMNEGSWEIITVHDYCAGIDVLKTISPSMWIAPIGDVLKYIRVRNATLITGYASAGQTISFNAVHTLTTFTRQQLDGTPLLPIVFDNPVTLRVPISSTTSILDAQANGVSISTTVGTISGTQYVWFSLPLTTTQHVVITTDTPTVVLLSNLSAAPSNPDGVLALFVAGGAAAGAFLVWKRQQRRQRLQRE